MTPIQATAALKQWANDPNATGLYAGTKGQVALLADAYLADQAELESLRADAEKWRQHEAFIASLKEPLPPKKIEAANAEREAAIAAKALRAASEIARELYRQHTLQENVDEFADIIARVMRENLPHA